MTEITPVATAITIIGWVKKDIGIMIIVITNHCLFDKFSFANLRNIKSSMHDTSRLLEYVNIEYPVKNNEILLKAKARIV